jgi:hypothetical protein
MGAWGTGSFENDEALDWVWELKEAEDTFILEDTLAQVNDAEEYIEAPECVCGIAAAEVVAAMRRRPVDNLPDDVEAFVKQLGVPPPKGLIASALRALDKIKTNSELQEEWSQSPEFDQWTASIEDLEERLT